jgi:hypothetical protein
MKHHLVSGAVGFLRSLDGVGQMRQDGKRQRIGQGEQITGGLEVLPQIVNDNGGAEQVPDLSEPPSANSLSPPRQADVGGTPSVPPAGLVRLPFQAILFRLSLKGGHHGRIGVRGSQNLDGRISSCGRQACWRFDPDL